MKTYTVIYRTGGTQNFEWHRVFTVFSDKSQAQAKQQELAAMGYPALIHDTKMLESVGMPEYEKEDENVVLKSRIRVKISRSDFWARRLGWARR